MSYENRPSEERRQYRNPASDAPDRRSDRQDRIGFEETVTFPLRQTMEFWQNVGEMSMMGFDAAERVQRRGMELTRSVLENYLRSFEELSSEAEQMVPRQMHVEAETASRSEPEQQSESRSQQVQYVGGGRETDRTDVRTQYGEQSASSPGQYGASGPDYGRIGEPPRGQQGQQPPQAQSTVQGQPGQQPAQSQTARQPAQGQPGQQPARGQTSQRPERSQQKRYGERRQTVGPMTPQG